MAAPFQLLSGRGYTPVGYATTPRFAVPYDVGQVNRVDRPTAPGYDYPGLPQDQPAPIIDHPDTAAFAVEGMGPMAPPHDVGAGIEGFGSRRAADIGMGIPVDMNPGGPVTSSDLGSIDSAVRALSTLGGKGGGFKMPTPTATPPRRPVGSRPEFIYTNPAAAQQAASNYAARMQAQTGQEVGYQNYLSRLNEGQSVDERAQAAREQQDKQLAAATQEGAANRATSERIAGMNESVRQQRAADSAWAQNEQAADMGEQTAAMLNRDPNARVDRKFAWMNPATGKWESRFRRQPRPVQAPVPGVQSNLATPVAPPPSAPVPVAIPEPSQAAVDSNVGAGIEGFGRYTR